MTVSRRALDVLPLFAVGSPALIVCNVSPSSTVLNQVLSVFGWGLLVATLGLHVQTLRSRARFATATVYTALLLVFAASASGITPLSLGVSFVGAICITGVLVYAGNVNSCFDLKFLLWACAIVGCLTAAMGAVQFAALDIGTGLIAPVSLPGRAAGNLRQPNHFSSLLLWSAISIAYLVETGRLRRIVAQIAYAAMVAGIVMSASRTGLLGVVLLALWGLLDRRLSRSTRFLLIASPLIYVVTWLGLAAWAEHSQQAFAGRDRFATTRDISSSRFAIWSNTMQLIADHPWAGVGAGNFNFAWTLTPFPDRPVAFFDHTHNIVLQFVVEYGLPVGILVSGLLTYALWAAFKASSRTPPPEGTALRAAFMMVLMMALHSQFEYPLWYAYFLLPTAFMLGLCLGAVRTNPASTAIVADTAASSPPPPRRGSPLLVAAGLLMAASGAFVIYDYMKVAAIFTPAADGKPLAQRIAEGQRSVFFSHHADYAAITTAEHPGEQLEAGLRAAHNLLDTRLMIALSRAYAERGDLERARYVAARLREFRKDDAAEFFAPCDEKPRSTNSRAPADRPFQCDPPTAKLTYRDFM